LLWPAAALRAQGADVVVKEDVSGLLQWDHDWRSSWPGPQPPPYAYVVGLEEKEADVVVIQRPAHQWLLEAIALLQMDGVRIVVDVDDHFHAVQWALRETPWFSADVVDRACRMADVVTVTTSALADRYGYGHGVVLPNVVPAYYLAVQADDPTAEPRRTHLRAGTLETRSSAGICWGSWRSPPKRSSMASLRTSGSTSRQS